MSADPLLVRAVGLYGPLLLAAGLAFGSRADRRTLAGALLGTLWNLPALLAAHLFAVAQGWWAFQPVPGAVAGFPADVWIGWAVLWGAVPVLIGRRVPVVVVVAVAACLDVVLMPACAPLLQLGPRWGYGEAVAVGVALVPGALLARWTADDRRLAARAALQVACFAALTVWFGSGLGLHADGGSWAQVLDRPRWVLSSGAQLLLPIAAIALTAVIEFAQRGGGTPFPYDPPRRLVTTGPYSYVANPMQLGLVLVLLGWAALLGSLGTAAGAMLGAVFAVGMAGWHEGEQLRARYGGRWRAYRRAVRPWWPRWRPYVSTPATLYVGFDCEVCSPVGRWVAARDPRGLALADAAAWPGPNPLRRATYLGADGHREEGVRAVARALEHVHLGWAVAGWVLRLPVLASGVQVLIDACGGGPREIAPMRVSPPHTTTHAVADASATLPAATDAAMPGS